MRVVAGTARGRRLAAPPGRSTRPTSDRVREAVFNALGSLGAVEGATVVDLFAGSGALGIEALSRGAAWATFVEQDRRAVAVIEENLATVGFAEQATVVVDDVDRWLDRRLGTEPLELALVDPPYAFAGWPALLDLLPAELAVLESDRTVALGERWHVLREKRYGDTVVTIARLANDPTRSI